MSKFFAGQGRNLDCVGDAYQNVLSPPYCGRLAWFARSLCQVLSFPFFLEGLYIPLTKGELCSPSTVQLHVKHILMTSSIFF